MQQYTEWRLAGIRTELLRGTQGGINADGSKMKKGESMVFELLPEEVDSTKDMLLEVSLITTLNPNTTVPLDSKIPIKLSGNGNYNYELISDSGELRLIKSVEIKNRKSVKAFAVFL